jgi:hypothetical protein
MTPVNPRVAPCTHCKAQVRIPEDVKPGHRLVCTHCNTCYYAWQLLARSYRLEIPPHE